jgi:tRNA-2-methylthio-N6-dimethylallyladenosine synthase
MTLVRTDGKRKRVFIRTYGCQMNVYDSDRMADVLRPLGYALAVSPTDADLVVLNTCHIREHASEKVYSELGRLRDQKLERRAAGGDLTIAVAGCVAQAEGEEIVRRQPAVDIVVGPQAYHRLPQLWPRRSASAIRQCRQAPARGGRSRHGLPGREQVRSLPAPQGVRAGSAFLSIQEGCDKFCTFCVVPYTARRRIFASRAGSAGRGAPAGRGGRIEITLLGQNVNAYHGEAAPKHDRRLDLVAGAPDPGHCRRSSASRRIRYTTSHPRDMDDDLITGHGQVPQLMPYLHLPVQSGSDRILEAMNRRHGRDLFRRIVDRLRDVRPDLALSSDSSSASRAKATSTFDDTMRLVSEVVFASAFSFKYSRRPGTPGSAMPDQGAGERQGGAPCRAAGPARRAGARIQSLQGRRDRAGAVCRTWPQARPDRRQDAVAAVGLCRRGSAPDRRYRRHPPYRRTCQ